MSLKEQKDRIFLNKVTHSVRASQAVLQYGVGAMVDFPEQTLMTAAPEYWKESVDVIHDERLERILHVSYFGALGNSDDSRFKAGISYVRFPEWYFCPKCRKFQPISEWIKEYKKKATAKQIEKDEYMIRHPRCPVDRQDLVVARIVTACSHGHIDDFPWVKWVHSQNLSGPKRVCSQPRLTFKTSATSAEGLEGLSVTCETCRCRATLKDAFDPDAFRRIDEKTGNEYNYRCNGKHPWKHTVEQCDEYPRVLQRGSSSVYFPIIASSLVIPPYSSIVTKKVEDSQAYGNCRNSISDMMKLPGITADMKAAILDNYIAQYSEQIALETSIPKEKVRAILKRKWQTVEGEETGTSGVGYRSEEYEALSGEAAVDSEDRDMEFVRESTDIEDYKMPYLHRVSLIHKIREVQALVAFSRLKPVDGELKDESKTRISVKEPNTDWYPAYQVRGEGIFIEFDRDMLNKWRDGNKIMQDRADQINENWKKSFIGSQRPRNITPKYLFLHTVAHLLIKQLSFECGYSVASLKERIYCSEEAEGKEMAGILIYTASGDSEGTLGGLVRQGRPDVFPHLFKKAVESAITCSNDPVCSTSNGQGRDSLNMAACYSCTLIPETSCEQYNVFLDRGAVIGTYNHPDIGFFSDWVYKTGSSASSSRGNVVPNTAETETDADTQGAVIIGPGIDMIDTPYSEIWEHMLLWSDSDDEKKLLKMLSERSVDFDRYEKPVQDAAVTVSDGKGINEYSCDLVWKKSKVMLFTVDNHDGYEAIKSSEWKCFWTEDLDLTPDVLLSALKEA